jgi:hypothetical protein
MILNLLHVQLYTTKFSSTILLLLTIMLTILNLVVCTVSTGTAACTGYTKFSTTAVVVQGRVAQRGYLVTRITVTLSIFILSTRFLVQNCRESQGASF